MGKEEGCNEVGLRRPERQVGIVYIFHVRRREHAILLSCEVDEEGDWCYPACCGVCDTHFDEDLVLLESRRWGIQITIGKTQSITEDVKLFCYLSSFSLARLRFRIMTLTLWRGVAIV